MDNVSHAQAVAALKRAGKRVELTVKRKAVVKVRILKNFENSEKINKIF